VPTVPDLPPHALWTAHTELDPKTGASLEYPTLALTENDLDWLDAAQQAMHTAHKAVHPDTGELAEYKSLRSSSEGTEWEASCANEFGRLAQGVLPHMPKGTDTIHFIAHTAMPKGRRATYLRLVTADRPQKTETKRTRATVGGDKINYPGDVSTKTAGLTTAKLLINSVLSTPGARCMVADIKDFYLNNPMSRYEYMKIPVDIIPAAIMQQYNLAPLVHNGFVYVEIRKGMYGLPQAGRIANDALVQHLSSHGYIQDEHTHGLFTHTTRPVAFCLVVDDFAVKYVGKEHADHLMSVLRKKYTISTDWEAKLYCGLTLKWDYEKGTCDLSMPGYVASALQRFNHPTPTKAQHSPHSWLKPNYGARTQFTTPEDDSPPLIPSETLRLQEVVGTLLYYARAIDLTMHVALGSLAAAQSDGTQATMKALTHLLNYAASHPSATIRYHASGMILRVHSDASYLSERQARSRAGGFFYLGSHNDPVPITKPNGAVHILSTIMRQVLASALESEIGGIFYNAQECVPMRQTLEALGHPQPPTEITTDNEVADGIINDRVKQRRSKAIDMRFYWVRDRVRQGQFRIHWRSGQENLADYFTKHHPVAHHRAIRKVYFHEALCAYSTTPG
jgi:hypothetical protein